MFDKNGGNNVMKKIKVGIYIRVSTQEQAESGYSIHEQEERLTKYADVLEIHWKFI